jgi:sugar (pentulose or hexulose) kinase
MTKLPAILIFDVGKTNKKLLLFDEDYHVVYETSTQLKETVDEDNFPCEDVYTLTNWMKESFSNIVTDDRFEVRAVNFSGYGASFVLLDENLSPFLPIYNYLKPYPVRLEKKFYKTYGGKGVVSRETASPVLGNLNSGMQLYRLKYERPDVFDKIKYALHLPQYLSFVFTGKLYSDITSIGCHTNLWDFKHKHYHEWVTKEGIDKKLPVILASDSIGGYTYQNIPVGIGLHDSSAALIPYLKSFQEPFVLISTGTWCISLNPFNHSPLTDEELNLDCLCYLSYVGNPVKASRLFAGYTHEQQVKRLATYFNKPNDYYRQVRYDEHFLKNSVGSYQQSPDNHQNIDLHSCYFENRDLQTFPSFETAYHQLINDIIKQQIKSNRLVLSNSMVKKIFVDGGFSSNAIYMQLLANAFPELEVYAASVAQASALGAAIVFHQSWNSGKIPTGLTQLTRYYGSAEN